jgi:hypothetical protein
LGNTCVMISTCTSKASLSGWSVMDQLRTLLQQRRLQHYAPVRIFTLWYRIGAGIKCPMGAADQNLNESCMRKAAKYFHLNLMLGAFEHLTVWCVCLMLGAKGLTHDFKLNAKLSFTHYCYGQLSYVCFLLFKENYGKLKLSLIWTPSHHI